MESMRSSEMKKTTPRVTIQSLHEKDGERAIMCGPVSFYMLLQREGYIPDDVSPLQFCEWSDQPDNKTSFASHEKPFKNWSRPGLTKAIREKFDAPIVSWIINGEDIYGGHDVEYMKQAGYLQSDREVTFFKQQVEGRDIKDIVSDGYPVIVTMNPGFGSSGGESVHAVIIDSWEDGTVRVIDPDERNQQELFSEDEIRENLSREAAGTIILPKE